MFSLHFDCLKILVFYRFGFEGWIRVLITSVPDLCILLTSVGNLIVSYRLIAHVFISVTP